MPDSLLSDPAETLTLPDGRRMAWEDAGDPHGTPILFCHGSPGTRLQRRVFITADTLRELGVRMITPDRPGYGQSDHEADRTIPAWTADVAELVRHLGITRFGVLGFSGGTPYALALAASELPVAALGIVSGDVPPGAVDDVPEGLPAMAEEHPLRTSLMMRLIAVAAAVAPGFTADRGTDMLSDADKEVVSDPQIRRRFILMLRDALRQGPRGPLLDLQLEARGWDTPAPREGIPVFLWHGEADADSPISIARYLDRVLPNTELEIYPGEGHVSAFVHHAPEMVGSMRDAVRAAH